MKSLIIGLAILFTSSLAYAEYELVGGYDHYLTPNSGNNYDDAYGVSIGLEHDIRGNLRGRIEGTHITDIGFPYVHDPKGSFGELRGYGATYNLVYLLPYNNRLTFEALVGIGGFWWDFKENPFLQTKGVTVDVDPSVLYQAKIGATYKLKDDWKLEASVGWLDTTITKNAHDATSEWLILDGHGKIGLQYIPIMVGIKKRF